MPFINPFGSFRISMLGFSFNFILTTSATQDQVRAFKFCGAAVVWHRPHSNCPSLLFLAFTRGIVESKSRLMFIIILDFFGHRLFLLQFFF